MPRSDVLSPRCHRCGAGVGSPLSRSMGPGTPLNGRSPAALAAQRLFGGPMTFAAAVRSSGRTARYWVSAIR